MTLVLQAIAIAGLFLAVFAIFGCAIALEKAQKELREVAGGLKGVRTELADIGTDLHELVDDLVEYVLDGEDGANG